MTLLRSISGKFYDVPDSTLSDYEVPGDAIDEFFADPDRDETEDPGPPDDFGEAPQVVIYVSGGDDGFDLGPSDAYDSF